MNAKSLAAGLACLALAACGSGGETVGGVTPDEAQALNDAAEMLDDVYNNSRVEIPPVAPPANADNGASAAQP